MVVGSIYTSSLRNMYAGVQHIMQRPHLNLSGNYHLKEGEGLWCTGISAAFPPAVQESPTTGLTYSRESSPLATFVWLALMLMHPNKISSEERLLCYLSLLQKYLNITQSSFS